MLIWHLILNFIICMLDDMNALYNLIYIFSLIKYQNNTIICKYNILKHSSYDSLIYIDKINN